MDILIIIAAVIVHSVNGCSNILVTPKASKSGVALLGDNDDASKRFGMVTHFPAQVRNKSLSFSSDTYFNAIRLLRDSC